jgi:hypothetical protein
VTGESAARDGVLAVQPTQPPQPVDPRRSIGAVASALTDEVARVERPGIRVGAALVFGAVVILGFLGRSVPALAWLDRLPWWLPVALIVTAVAIVVAAMPMVLLPRRILDAWVAYTYLGLDGRAGWQRLTGEPFPESPDAVNRWLARPAAQYPLQRAMLLLGQGRTGEAADILAEAEPADQAESFLHAQLAWIAAFTAGRDDPGLLDRCRVLAAAAGGAARDRPLADAAVEALEAMRALAVDGDWVEPLVRARHALGGLARGVAFRHLFLPRLRRYGRTSLLVAGALIALQVIAGSMEVGSATPGLLG